MVFLLSWYHMILVPRWQLQIPIILQVEKELEKAAAKEIKIRNEIEAQKKADNDKRRQAILREQVESYRAQKQREETEQKMAEELRAQCEQQEKQRNAPHIIHAFRQRVSSETRPTSYTRSGNG